MSALKPKQAIFENLAVIAQAIGHANRLELLEHVAQGARPVEELAQISGLSIANTSRHLQILRRANLVRGSRRGKQVLYELVGAEQVIALLHALGVVGESNTAEIGRVIADYFTARDSFAPVSRTELFRQVEEGLVVVLDVRPEDEFALGHVPGALNIPFGELEARLGELPADIPVVAYCRGPYCVLSFEAVASLRGHGRAAFRLEDGFPEWKAAGLAVEASA